MYPERELEKMVIRLESPPKSVGAYVPAVQMSNLVYTSGHEPDVFGRGGYQGKVGRDLTIEQGYEAVRNCAINCLATTKDLVGDLDKVQRIVKVLGFVNSADGFSEQPLVMNGLPNSFWPSSEKEEPTHNQQ
jgi:enamine deaminase RidA (YjgF/YER057c/UK114 family)